jgi:hypothetical protein
MAPTGTKADRSDVSPRRSFIRGAAAALTAGGLVMARPAAGQTPDLLAHTDLANTFSAPQTLEYANRPLTVKGMGDGIIEALDQATAKPVVTISDIGKNADPVNGYAGAMYLYGQNGLGANGLAWSVGVDVAVPPYNRDFYIGKARADDSVRDVIYLLNNGADEPQVSLFPAGPSNPPAAGVSIFGQLTRQGDPDLLHLRPTADHANFSLAIQKLGEAQPTFGINKNGDLSWGGGASTPPGGKLNAAGATFSREAAGNLLLQHGGGAGIVPVLSLMSSHAGAVGDGVRFSMVMDGFTLVRMESSYKGSQHGKLSIKAATGTGVFGERLVIDDVGVSFNGVNNGNGIARPALGPAATNNPSTQTLVNNIRSALIAYGLAVS